MALVTLSGYPCSGKSTRAQELKSMFESRLSVPSSATGVKRVIVVNDESLGIPKSDYDDSKTERAARGNLLSATIRALGRDTIVLCDGLNYIKGFRYQLYCAAREVSVRICTVHVAAKADLCTSRNESRPPESRYSRPTLENLISRYEEPSAAVRWDSPLVVLPWCDSLWDDGTSERGGQGLAGRLEGLRVVDDWTPSGSDSPPASPSPSPSEPAEPPDPSVTETKSGRWSAAADAIFDAATTSTIKPTHVATRPNNPSTTSLASSLHLVDSTTTSVIDGLLASISAAPSPVGALSFPVAVPDSASRVQAQVTLSEGGKLPTVAALQRVRMSYIGLRRVAGAKVPGSGPAESATTADELVAEFASYIETSLRR